MKGVFRDTGFTVSSCNNGWSVESIVSAPGTDGGTRDTRTHNVYPGFAGVQDALKQWMLDVRCATHDENP